MNKDPENSSDSQIRFDEEVNHANLYEYNRHAWDAQVDQGNRWTVPVTSEEVDRARNGDWSIVLTPTKPVPREWFGQLQGANVLCLAGSGGQQAPILAAAGANVTVFDASAKQLGQDETVASREKLNIKTVQGNMADLSVFEDAMFDLIFHPCSNSFVPNILPVWKESFRVLKPGGILMSGIYSPLAFIFNDRLLQEGVLKVEHPLPFSDLDSISEDQRDEYIAKNEPLCFGHTLDDQIGGQIDAGFAIVGFYEDRWGPDVGDPLSKFIATFFATRAAKPAS